MGMSEDPPLFATEDKPFNKAFGDAETSRLLREHIRERAVGDERVYRIYETPDGWAVREYDGRDLADGVSAVSDQWSFGSVVDAVDFAERLAEKRDGRVHLGVTQREQFGNGDVNGRRGTE